MYENFFGLTEPPFSITVIFFMESALRADSSS
jgi:hypothetical protein